MKMSSLSAAAWLLCTSTATLAGNLQVNITGLAGGGQIGCGLHATKASFPMGQPGVASVWVRPQGANAVCLFEDVAPGTYAVAVVHDLNGNRKTDTNVFGIPTEAWGVSGNVRPMMRPPSFAEAAFNMQEAPVTLDIEVK